MQSKEKFIKTFAVFVLGVVLVIFAAPDETSSISQILQTASEPLARLFQILFILFIISPPLIVVLLFLIWQELRTRNKMK